MTARSARARSSCLALMCLVGASASAQTLPIFLRGPHSVNIIARPAAAPTPTRDAPPAQRPTTEAAKPVPPAAAPEAEEGLAPGFVLRHLSNNIQGYRLAGEIDGSEWPIYLTAAQAKEKLRFQIAFIAAVSVMPEASVLTLTINDERIESAPIDSFTAIKTVSFDIPSGMLRAGFNSVRIGANHRHRVDCSLAATNELWTQIDPTRTGLVVNATTAAINNLTDLAALPADDQGAMPIRAVFTKDRDSNDISRALRAVELISIAGRFDQPVVDIGPLVGGRYGFNLIVGDSRQVREAMGAEAPRDIDRPRTVFLPATAKRRATIVVTGANAEQIDEAMRSLQSATVLKGAPAGLRAAAAFPGYRLQGGQRVKLKDIGLIGQKFSGRRFKTAFNILLPPDFYPADYGRATLRLGGGYAPGLSQGSRIIINIEGRTAVSLALPKASGDVFKADPLPLPLGFFKPGLNRIEIEAQVQTPGDQSCDPIASIGAPSRFLLLGDTEIEMPTIARIARAPDLAVTATGGFPYASEGAQPILYTPSLDEKSLGAALTIAAHLSVAAGRALPFTVSTTAPKVGEGPTLAVAPLAALDAQLLDALEIPAAKLSKAWSDSAHGAAAASDAMTSTYLRETRNRLQLQKNFPIACQAAAPAWLRRKDLAWLYPRAVDHTPVASVESHDGDAGEADQQGAQEDHAESELYEEWNARLEQEPGVLRRLRVALARAPSSALTQLEHASEWAFGHLKRLQRAELEPTPHVQLLLGQGTRGDGAKDVWTVVTAPDPEGLSENVKCLIDPRVARQISGRLSLLEPGRAHIAATPAENARFIATQPFSIGNVRLIAAGWMSLHSVAFVALAFGVAPLLAFATLNLIRSVGRRSE